MDKCICGFIAIISCIAFSSGCEISLDCDKNEGRSLCYEKVCRKDVPCNKDNDCFFYGAADVSVGRPHPKCYKNPAVNSPPGYGICMLREYAGDLERLPGGDVMDQPEVRDTEKDIDNIEDIFRIIKKAKLSNKRMFDY